MKNFEFLKSKDIPKYLADEYNEDKENIKPQNNLNQN